MSEISFAPRRGRPSTTGPGNTRTPRLHPRNTRGKYSYYSQNILPSIQTSSTVEQNQTALLKTLFNAFVETLSKLLAHNSATTAFRNTISSQSQEIQRLFGIFLNQAIKQFGTMPVLQRGAKPGDAGSKSILQASGIPFLKKWKIFAQNCCELQFTGPEAIKTSIIANFEIIVTSLDFISQSCGGPNITIHNTPSKNIQAMLHQKSLLQNEIEIRLENPKDVDAIKATAVKVKSYSRLLNDCFAKEFSQCGIGTNDLVRIRQKTYTACCDIISALKASYLFDMDMNTLFGALDEFQDCLTIILERLDLPTSYIYHRQVILTEGNSPRSTSTNDNLNEDEEGEDDMETFNGITDLSDLCSSGLQNLQEFYNNGAKLTKFLQMIEEMSKKIVEENNKLKEENEKNKQEKMDNENKLQEDIDMRKDKITELEDEIQRLKDVVDAQEQEITMLRENNHDNEFKKCLRDVARKLGGVLKEEEVNFVNQDNIDEDDDQLISKVDALTVYVVERKCQKCVKHKEEEEEMRALLSVVVDPDEEDISFLEFIKLVREKCDEMMDQIDKLKQTRNNLQKDLDFFIDGYSPILEFFNIKSSPKEEYTNNILNAAREMIELHNKEVQALAQAKDEELNHFAENISNKFIDYIDNNEEIIGTEVQKASKITDLAVEKIKKVSNSYEDSHKSLTELKERLAKFLGIPVPEGDIEFESAIKLLQELENRPNPLKEPLDEANNLNKFLISSIEVINNRFRGVSGTNEKKPASSMTPKALVNTTIKMLEHFQDSHEKALNDIQVYKQKSQALRLAMENADLKSHKFLGLEDINLKELKDDEIIERVDKFISDITKEQASDKYIAKADLDPLFKDVYDLVPVTTRSDPMKYIPEVNNAFISLNNSIMTLKPFASILNEIFSTFDCKFNSFLPGSPPMQTLRQQLMQLHTSLSNVVPAKTNSLVFLVLSRFIALLSSFLSALTALSYSSQDQQAQNFLFNLQQENERLNNLLEENHIKS